MTDTGDPGATARLARLHMLVLLKGRERTTAEFAALFDTAGLRLTADVPTPAGVHVLEAQAVH